MTIKPDLGIRIYLWVGLAVIGFMLANNLLIEIVVVVAALALICLLSLMRVPKEVRVTETEAIFEYRYGKSRVVRFETIQGIKSKNDKFFAGRITFNVAAGVTSLTISA